MFHLIVIALRQGLTRDQQWKNNLTKVMIPEIQPTNKCTYSSIFDMQKYTRDVISFVLICIATSCRMRNFLLSRLKSRIIIYYIG